MRSPYPEFVLTNIICIEKALKGTEIVFLLTRFYCSLTAQSMGVSIETSIGHQWDLKLLLKVLSAFKKG